MEKIKVGFLKPNNNIQYMEYNEALNYCKEICYQPENQESFNKFKQDYTYLPAYLDYVLFELKYQMVNPLFHEGKCLIADNNYLYMSEYLGENYNENREYYQENHKDTDLYCMSKVSQSDFQIKKQSVEKIDNCLMAPDMIGMMSGTTVLDKSHGTTGKTILNYLLSQSETIANHFYQYQELSEEDMDEQPINYLIKTLGFLRLTEASIYPMIIGNDSALTEEEKQFIDRSKENGYHYFSLDVVSPSLTIEYEKGEIEWNRKQM